MPNFDVEIREFMTPMPYTIHPDETLAMARKRMQELHVRHLPVLVDGSVIGVLSERDLYVLGVFPEIDFRTATVRFAMTPEPFVVEAQTPVREVAAEMVKRRIGSAVILGRDRRLLGMFTDTDALKLLAFS